MAYRRGSDPSLDVDLPITPMLDLAFQVLLFFILTYHPSQLEGQMDMSLPDVAEAKAAVPQPNQQAGNGLDLPAEVTVTVRARPEPEARGEIRQITVQDKSGSKEIPVEPRNNKNEFLKQDDLRKYLSALRPGLGNQDDIKLAAESALIYARVIEVMDACRAAGFSNVSFSPPPDVVPGS